MSVNKHIKETSTIVGVFFENYNKTRKSERGFTRIKGFTRISNKLIKIRENPLNPLNPRSIFKFIGCGHSPVLSV